MTLVIVTSAVSRAVSSERFANPFMCPTDGAAFQGSTGIVALSEKTGTGLRTVSSYSVKPSTDLPVFRPDANSAKLRTGVSPAVGRLNGLFKTWILDVAIE